MTKSEASQSTPPPKVRWIHTGIDAPHELDVQGFNQLDTGRGIAYSAELVHPTLGVVGRIANLGDGGDTEFHSYGNTRFSWRDLESFAAQCTQDGVPLGLHYAAVVRLLDAAIDEAEYAEQVTIMRLDGLFLVRSFEPRTEHNHGTFRGAALSYKAVMLRRTHRQRIAEKLAQQPELRLISGAYWQMFNGREWVPLLAERFSAEQIASRVDALSALRDASTEAHNTVVDPQGPIDGLYPYSGLSSDAFTLVEDAIATVHTNRWCRCTTRRPRLARFEKWSLKGGPLGSGTIHAARPCRRLVTID
jgi:hypothetical protein